LRGGGGNFGVVTSFEFRLHSVGPTVLAGPILWDASDAGEVLRFYRDFVRDAPDELGTVVRFGAAPPLPEVYLGAVRTLPTKTLSPRSSPRVSAGCP
jgi:hypothetical protein